MHVVKPLLIACIGRTLTAAPLGRREDDVEVRRVPVLPRAGGLDPSRPTVILLDRTLLASTGDERRVLDELAAIAAIVGWGDQGEDAPREDFPSDLLTSFIPGGSSPAAVITALRGAFRHAATLVTARTARTAPWCGRRRPLRRRSPPVPRTGPRGPGSSPAASPADGAASPSAGCIAPRGRARVVPRWSSGGRRPAPQPAVGAGQRRRGRRNACASSRWTRFNTASLFNGVDPAADQPAHHRTQRRGGCRELHRRGRRAATLQGDPQGRRAVPSLGGVGRPQAE